jgi:hypothetical protein
MWRAGSQSWSGVGLLGLPVERDLYFVAGTNRCRHMPTRPMRKVISSLEPSGGDTSPPLFLNSVVSGFAGNRSGGRKMRVVTKDSCLEQDVRHR